MGMKPEMPASLPDEYRVFLSKDLASRREIRFAVVAVVVSAAFFVAAVPFAKTPLAHLDAFIPVYQSALILSDLITAALLFGHFNVMRTKSLLLLASGYLFTGFIAMLHLLVFPGVFSPAGLAGTGSQSAPWLWTFWHGVFPLVVVLYVLITDKERRTTSTSDAGGPGRDGVAFSVFTALTAALAAALACFVLATQDLLPALIVNGAYTPWASVIWSATWAMSLIAAITLWWRRPHTMLDIWLIVVMCAWLSDIALCAVFNGARYDLGWYAGRIYGLLAAGFLLFMLLIETGRQANELVRANRQAYQLLQIRTLERDRAELKQEVAEATNIVLDEFVATASHELRTPLTSIAASMGLLAGGAGGTMPPMVGRLVNIAHVHTQRMVRLVNDILDIAKIDAGSMPFNLAPVNLAAVAEQAVEASRTFAETHDVSIRFVAGSEICFVRADADRLMQIVANLLSNAIKFSPRGETVTVGVERRADMGCIVVRDRGIGIAEAFRPRIFDKFAQAEAVDTRRKGGTGLGLSIVKKIVDRHGGSIDFEPATDGGTVFSVGIPLWTKAARSVAKQTADSLAD
jgi:two-component system, sensor histidine kinase and response regulator